MSLQDPTDPTAPPTLAYTVLPPVNETLNFVEWTPDTSNSCDTTAGITSWTGTFVRWLGLTGWYNVSFTFQPDPVTDLCNLYSQSNVQDENSGFCSFYGASVCAFGKGWTDLIASIIDQLAPDPGPSTYNEVATTFENTCLSIAANPPSALVTDVYYSPNTITANLDGSATYVFSLTKSGSCSQLLKGFYHPSFY